MKKNKKYIISIGNTKGIKKNTDIESSSLEEALKYIETLKDINVRIIIFDSDEKIVYSRHHNQEHDKKEEHHYHNHNNHNHGHHNHHDDDDDSYA